MATEPQGTTNLEQFHFQVPLLVHNTFVVALLRYGKNDLGDASLDHHRYFITMSVTIWTNAQLC